MQTLTEYLHSIAFNPHRIRKVSIMISNLEMRLRLREGNWPSQDHTAVQLQGPQT